MWVEVLWELVADRVVDMALLDNHKWHQLVQSNDLNTCEQCDQQLMVILYNHRHQIHKHDSDGELLNQQEPI